jgi:hypothetical protein
MDASWKDWLEANQRHGMELLGPLANNSFADAYIGAIVDYNVQLMLYMKFIWPSEVMKLNADLEQFMEQFSLNGLKSS